MLTLVRAVLITIKMSFILFIIITMFAARSTVGEEFTILHGIVNSPITLTCPSPTTDVETVKWTVNSSEVPFVSFYPKDDVVEPEDYDRRLSFKNQTNLHISALRTTDRGRYECSIVSTAFADEYRYVSHLNVTDGCLMPHFSRPLLSVDGCLSWSYINFETHCTFGCDSGFQLKGNQTLLCQANGLFDTNLPRCKEIKVCKVPPLSQHLLSRSQGCSPGQTIVLDTICSFNCEDGYTLKGDESVTCLENEQFDELIPNCEENRCNINTTHVQLEGITGDCLNSDTVSVNSTCVFVCEKDYTLNGSNMVTCMSDGHFDGNFPACEAIQKDEKQVNLVPLVTLIIPVLSVLAGIAVCMFKKNREHKTDSQEIPGEKELFVEKKKNSQKVKFQRETSALQVSQSTGRNKTRQERHFKDLSRGFFPLLVSQLHAKNRVPMLERLHDIELRHNLPSVSCDDDFDALKNNIPCSSQEMSQEQAFAWYVVTILSFISNKKLSNDLKSEIIGLTGQQPKLCVDPKDSAALPSHVAEETVQSECIKKYLDIVSKAFAVVINTENLHIRDEQEKCNRTAKVSQEMMTYLQTHQRVPEGNGSSTHTRSTVQSQDGTEDKAYFGKLCVYQINQCASLYDKVNMRYQVLRCFLTHSGFEDSTPEDEFYHYAL